MKQDEGVFKVYAKVIGSFVSVPGFLSDKGADDNRTGEGVELSLGENVDLSIGEGVDLCICGGVNLCIGGVNCAASCIGAVN